MKKIITGLFVFTSFFYPVSLQANSNWYYPISKFTTRPSLKPYGQYFNNNFYVGKKDIFPNKFTGYHAAVDLEIFPAEKDQLVPVYAVTDGQISYASLVSGYGGVILLKLADTDKTAIYGHLRLSEKLVKVGDQIPVGTPLAYLGQEFSKDTGGERKHLHFGIYQGQDLYFAGYEPTEAALNTRWIDPVAYVSQYTDPTSPTTPIPTPLPEYKKSPSIFTQIINFIKNILQLP